MKRVLPKETQRAAIANSRCRGEQLGKGAKALYEVDLSLLLARFSSLSREVRNW
ncbi:MAG: hypothetical protein ACFCBU_09665 [Cyanophyceae cyanobacterium]